MAKFEVTSPDGKRFEIEAPDGATNEQVMEYAKSQWAQAPAKAKPADPSFADRVLASPPGRLLKGLNTAVEGAAELVPHALGQVSSLGGLMPNPTADVLFGLSKKARQYNADMESVYQGARERTGSTGMDIMRGAGELTGGVIGGLAAPVAPVTTLGRAGYGALMGGLGGAMAPTREVDDEKFVEKKAGQIALGAGTGGIATPAVGKIVDTAGPLIDKGAHGLRALMTGGPKVDETKILEQLRFDLAKEDINIDLFPEAARQRVVKEVADSLRKGQKLDGAAALRKIDLDAFGGGTQGQITRDPAQWNREFNLRQVENAGEPLVDQAMRIRQETGRRLSQYGGSTTESSYEAGKKALASLLGKDAPVESAVDSAYKAAKAADGRYAPLNTQQFSHAANNVLDEEMLGPALPERARNLLNQVSEGKIPLNVNTATMLERRLSGIRRDLLSGAQPDKEGALAVNVVLRALRSTDLLDDAASTAARPAAVDPLMAMGRNLDMPGTVRVTPEGSSLVSGDRLPALPAPASTSRALVPHVPQPQAAAAQPAMSAREAFQQAKRMAAERFATHRKVPALKDALDDAVQPEQFVSKYVLGGSVDDVMELGKFIPDEGKQAIRDQLAKHLERAAFGENLSKDGVMAVERYAKTLSGIGREKLSAFFPEETVDDLFRIARVNSYVNQQPAGITPNRSGTAGAIANLLQRIQGVPVAVPIIRGLVNQGRATSALTPEVPSEAIPLLTPALQSLLPAVPLGAGVTTQP